MKFIIGEGGLNWLERATYRGGIGLFYNDTWSGLLSYLIFAVVCILAAIGLITVIKWIFTGRKSKEDPGKRWLRTGKM